MPELFKLHAQFQNELLLIESQQIGYELSPDLFQELREALQVNICANLPDGSLPPIPSCSVLDLLRSLR